MRATPTDGSVEDAGAYARKEGGEHHQGEPTEVNRSSGGVRKRYAHFPKYPLEWKIQEYVRLLNEGWGRNYARAQAGLRIGRADYKTAMDDIRVVFAHEKNRIAFNEKQRGKF